MVAMMASVIYWGGGGQGAVQQEEEQPGSVGEGHEAGVGLHLVGRHGQHLHDLMHHRFPWIRKPIALT